jgi:hypothetical protein
MDHDARFKMLLKSLAVLRGFFDAFLPEVAKFIDFNVLEFVDKEKHAIDVRRRTGDLLVKTRFKGEAAGFLIHLEHQAQLDRNLGRRMLEYFTLDWQDFDLPVYPVAVLSHREPARISLSPVYVDFPNGRVLMFKFDVIDLAAMDAERYIRTANPAALALASRMRFDESQRVRLTGGFIVNLAETPISHEDQQLVAGYFSAYQPLSHAEALQLEREMSKVMPDMAREKVIQLTNPFIELGIHRGRQQGEIELVLRQLKRRLGSLTPAQEESVRMLKLRRIEALGEALLEFNSRTDLDCWLKAHSK